MKTNHQAFTESNNKNKSVNKKPKVSQKSIPNEVECSMSGSLALAFRMSQIVGIAPVKFERQRDGSRVSVSRAMIVWCLFYVTMWIDAIYLYAGYYYAYIILLILVTQFIICVLEIYRTMKSLNDILEGVSQIHKYYQPYNEVFVVPNKSVNQVIDSLAAVSDNVYLDAKSAPKTLPETIRLLALMYGSACDAVEQLNCCFAPELLALVASFLLHLVVTPYNFIDNITGGAVNYGLLVMQTLWCIIHFSCTVGLAEPCHITQIEIKRTNRLVSYLMLQSTDELVKPELDNFGKFLYLNNTEYSPMGICVLTRSLVASIIGSVATYLVIIIQFQESDII
ncbi:gustatory receptor for sugar taste 43a-like [Ostrinia furnacalis]|uniref:gustatory receptor for sugar taste 43a-like n=1 Tax=Ostrinia furnacalis TaxID=93504 RepID=UPI00103B9491|nr:gustatory receptor for sugar taste 43a-like [Ostrinia furnacalis]